MSEHKVVYTKSRFPKQIAPGLCKGCHEPITAPRRKTWCSDTCKKRYDPYWVKKAVIKRDNHVCQMCGLDLKLEYWTWYRTKPHPLTKTHANMKAWRAAKPVEEYDHIIPFSEGGKTVVENMRTLCGSCHKARTAEWRRAKAMKKPK